MTDGGHTGLARADLARLEAALQRALETGDESALEVLGYGEVSSVVAWEAGDRRHACKRLPPFRDLSQLQAYRSVFGAYLAALRAAGLQPVESILQTIEHGDGHVVAWCVQPILPTGALLPDYVRACAHADALAVFARIVEQIGRCVDRQLGLDGQLSNWALVQNDLLYLDVTTPLLRDETGADLLDGELFMASLPWALRGVARRLLLKGILDKYYDPRGVVLDLLGNLYKERLAAFLPDVLALANTRVSPPFTTGEVARYYAGDARSWAFLQRLRQIDRFWQRKVRRRPYPFLLPGHIAR